MYSAVANPDPQIRCVGWVGGGGGAGGPHGSLPWIRHFSGTPPYDHRVYTTTSCLRPYSFDPNVKITELFYFFEELFNATTSLLRPGFYGPTVVTLTL